MRENGGDTVQAAYRAKFSRTPSKQFATGCPNGGSLFASFRIPCRQREKRVHLETGGGGWGLEHFWVDPCAIKNLFVPYLTQFTGFFYAIQSHKLVIIVSNGILMFHLAILKSRCKSISWMKTCDIFIYF